MADRFTYSKIYYNLKKTVKSVFDVSAKGVCLLRRRSKKLDGLFIGMFGILCEPG